MKNKNQKGNLKPKSEYKFAENLRNEGAEVNLKTVVKSYKPSAPLNELEPRSEYKFAENLRNEDAYVDLKTAIEKLENHNAQLQAMEPEGKLRMVKAIPKVKESKQAGR